MTDQLSFEGETANQRAANYLRMLDGVAQVRIRVDYYDDGGHAPGTTTPDGGDGWDGHAEDGETRDSDGGRQQRLAPVIPAEPTPDQKTSQDGPDRPESAPDPDDGGGDTDPSDGDTDDDSAADDGGGDGSPLDDTTPADPQPGDGRVGGDLKADSTYHYSLAIVGLLNARNQRPTCAEIKDIARTFGYGGHSVKSNQPALTHIYEHRFVERKKDGRHFRYEINDSGIAMLGAVGAPTGYGDFADEIPGADPPESGADDQGPDAGSDHDHDHDDTSAGTGQGHDVSADGGEP